MVRCARLRAETEESGAEGVTAGMPKRGSCAEVPEGTGWEGGAGRRFSTSAIMLVVNSERKLAKDSVIRCLTESKGSATLTDTLGEGVELHSSYHEYQKKGRGCHEKLYLKCELYYEKTSETRGRGNVMV